MSRPALSVPSTWGQEGGVSMLAKSTKLPADEGNGEMMGARRAIRITNRVMIRPATAVGLCEKRYQLRRQSERTRAERLTASGVGKAGAPILSRSLAADA